VHCGLNLRDTFDSVRERAVQPGVWIGLLKLPECQASALRAGMFGGFLAPGLRSWRVLFGIDVAFGAD
jgi:hypothetical protein